MTNRAWLAYVVLVTVACGTGGDKGDAGLELQLGTADATGTMFADMPAAATLTPGAQGGFHVWLSYRLKNVVGHELRALHVVRRESDGKLLSRGERLLEPGEVAQGEWWQSEMATPAFLCPTPLGVSVIDETAVFEVTVNGEDGAPLATQQVKTRLTCPTDGQAQFCQQICKG